MRLLRLDHRRLLWFRVDSEANVLRKRHEDPTNPPETDSTGIEKPSEDNSLVVRTNDGRWSLTR